MDRRRAPPEPDQTHLWPGDIFRVRASRYRHQADPRYSVIKAVMGHNNILMVSSQTLGCFQHNLFVDVKLLTVNLIN